MKRKLILTIILSGLFVVGGFVGCSSGNNINNMPTSNNEETNNNINNKEEDKLTIPDQVPYNINILPPDSIGIVYGNLTFTNNGEYPITYFKLVAEYTDKDGKREKTYYNYFDTIMPGETSPTIETFGSSDWKPITLEYKIYNKETGKSRCIKYDYKLDELKATNWIVS